MKNEKGLVRVAASFWCSPEMRKKLEDRARANSRNLTGEVYQIVRRAIYPKKKKNAEDKYQAIHETEPR
jgi:hypothetical protein